MARAGFAGSVIVEAGWKGKNLRNGFKNAQKQTQDFARSMRRILAAAAVACRTSGHALLQSEFLVSGFGAILMNSMSLPYGAAVSV